MKSKPNPAKPGRPAPEPSRRPAADPMAKLRAAASARRAAQDAALLAVSAALPATSGQGKIRLDLSGATAATVMAITLSSRDGLTDNVYYPAAGPVLDALSASYTGLRARADLIASLEQQLKASRLAEATEVMNAREIVRDAARYCESNDNSGEGLASAGWDLRRSPRPSVILPAPVRLILRATQFPGVMTARWRRVTNFRFYEIQMTVPEEFGAAPVWDAVPSRRTTVSTDTFPAAPIGRRMYLRVRTVGVRGPGPWSQEAAALIL